MSRLYLSPPHMCGEELSLIEEAFRTNWIAPLGPHVDALEKEFADAVGVRHAAALSSGTAALHLAVRLAGVRPGDEVLCSTLTFVASANPIVYEGASPVFVDSDEASWNMDPGLLAQELDDAARRGRLPRAVILAHLYGQSADVDPILEACRRHGVTLIEDAAEALGARYKGVAPGSRGRMGIFSFNGNKIITTSGGGMFVSDDPSLVQEVRFMSTQARDPAPHYEHSRLGYNYRMSNVLAAIGRSQLRVLRDRVRARRAVFEAYREALKDVPGITWMPESPTGESTRWLSVMLLDPEAFGASPEDVRLELEARDVESRPVWKPLHLQPLYRGCRSVGGKVAERLFGAGLCLPSGSQMTRMDLQRVVDGIVRAREARFRRGRTTRRLAG
ncbi:MAG TPA: aminotransferase class I/II-fold pyridoxal phosphate-dependent enzyme [Planctomycetota bacterium]|nr:aminotransferase class I/II-fold pyridoxal phosphate-dependent enzyme [Planctomycetota bacterium]